MTDKSLGYIIRRAAPNDVRAIATVHVQSWQSSYQGILPQDFLADLSIDSRMRGWTGHLSVPRRITLVGTTPDDRVVGFCDAGSNRDEPRAFDGEVYALYLLEEAKRKGLGRALFNEATAWLKQNDWSSWLAWVLTENAPARRFYETLGGQLLSEKPVTIGGVSYTEVAYGWRAG
ncbi:MAG TPA: GNAT family N-acetyltransferase [Anaeromyxobacteraceae bacterium]|nr:GNAT family N-acetyltransferase [Anaeromyxobacteraceae bacterium]